MVNDTIDDPTILDLNEFDVELNRAYNHDFWLSEQEMAEIQSVSPRIDTQGRSSSELR